MQDLLPTIAAHAKKHNLLPDKKLGQNFIFDSSLCDKIFKSANANPDEIILEVGPGPAGLTRSILSHHPSKVIAIEKDRRCIDLLNEINAAYSNLEIISGDALYIKLSEISKHKIAIISNLPYNVGTELIFRWLDEIDLISSITVMLQKEVVDRICAFPNNKQYGKLSIMCQVICDTYKLFDVSRESFHPPPKVTSSIVRLVPKADIPPKEIIERVRKITHIAFSARRKQIKKALKPLFPNIEEMLSKANISPDLRPENLSVEDYIRLAHM